MKRFTYANVIATLGFVIAVGLTPAGAHVTDSFSHLWDNHIKPELSQPGSINKPANPVHWTKLKGVPKGIADGKDAAAPKNVVRYDRIKVVSGNLTPTQNGIKLMNALGASKGATAQKPRLIQLEPGTFEIANMLEMLPYVDIAGSGRRASTILMGDSSPADTVISMASDTTLRDLTVKRFSLSPGAEQIGVLAPMGSQNASLERVNVTVDVEVASGGDPTVAYGVRAAGPIALQEADIEATANFGDAIAVFSTGQGEINDTDLTAEGFPGGPEPYGVNGLWVSQGGGVEVTDTLIEAIGPDATGVLASHGGVAFLGDSRIIGQAYGARTSDNSTLDIRASALGGGTEGVFKAPGGSVEVSFSQVSGGTSGTVACASNTNETLVYFPTTCPTD